MTGGRVRFLRDFGMIYFLIGALWIAFPTKGREAAIAWLPDFIGQEVVALFWVTAGVFAMAVGWAARDRPDRDSLTAYGFAGLQAVPAVLGLYFACAWLVHMLPPFSDGGAPTGVVTTVSYAALWYAARYAAQTGGEDDGRGRRDGGMV